MVLNVGGETASYDEDDCGDDAIIASIDAKGDPDMYDGAKSTNQYDEVSAFFFEEGETVGNSDVEGLGWARNSPAPTGKALGRKRPPTRNWCARRSLSTR